MEILGATTAELEQMAKDMGLPAYRGKQISEWVYKKGAESFDEMTNLSADLRRQLGESASLSRSKVLDRSVSMDGTVKFLLQFPDEQCVESVFLPYTDRITACVSTQVGCGAKCVFCATGMGGFNRNLTAGEIVDQVLTIQRETVRRVTNVVYMGMGEPLINYDATLKSVHLLNDEIGIGMRKITISTVGITPKIRALQKENLQINLAISLHAPEQALRNRLMPFTKRYPLNELIQTCKAYADFTGRRVTYEYLMIQGVNDSRPYAEQLVRLLRGSLSSVNLIPYNEVEGNDFQRSSPEAIDTFREVLEEAGIEVTQRFERGDAIDGACGQLKERQPRSERNPSNRR